MKKESVQAAGISDSLLRDRNHSIGRAVREMAAVIAIGAALGLLNNFFSPQRIPLFGQWSRGYGVPSPGGEHAATYGNTEINLAEALRLRSAGVLFIDARPAGAYTGGHIGGARSVPEDSFSAAGEIARGARDHPGIVVYCQGMECDEAHLLARRLRESGAENVFVFAGGFDEWVAAGMPVESGADQSDASEFR